MSTIEALENAYEICKLVRQHSGNVVASGEKSKSDEEWLKKSDDFIKWYDSRKRKGGDWKVKLEKSMNKLLEQSSKL